MLMLICENSQCLKNYMLFLFRQFWQTRLSAQLMTFPAFFSLGLEFFHTFQLRRLVLKTLPFVLAYSLH